MIFCEYTKKEFPDFPKRIYISPEKLLFLLKGHKNKDICIKSIKIEDKEIDCNSLLQVLIL